MLTEITQMLIGITPILIGITQISIDMPTLDLLPTFKSINLQLNQTPMFVSTSIHLDWYTHNWIHIPTFGSVQPNFDRNHSNVDRNHSNFDRNHSNFY